MSRDRTRSGVKGRLGHTVRFSHDIFFEWGFLHVLTERDEDWLKEIGDCGEPPAVARVVELLAQREYAKSKGWSQVLAHVASSQMRSPMRLSIMIWYNSHPTTRIKPNATTLRSGRH